MLKFDNLFVGDWVSVVRPKGIPISNYEVLHEHNGVIVMPLIVTPSDIYTIIRKEFCPPYIMRTPECHHYYTVISGTNDEGEEPFACMLRELQEEAGIEPIDYETLWQKDNMPMYKGSDRRSWNYIVNIKKFKIHAPVSDGTTGENLSSSLPISIGNLKTIIEKPNCDFLLYSMSAILFDVIEQKFLNKL